MASTTSAQLPNYQYDLLEDSAANDYDASSSYSAGNDDVDSAASLIGDPASSALSMSLMDPVASSNLQAEGAETGLNQTGRTSDFKQLMENRQNESNEFRIMIVCLGLIIVSVGVLANLMFSLFVLCRRRRRRNQRRSSTMKHQQHSTGVRQTSTTLIMASMCVAYMVFLVFYCFKISIYFNGDNIIKFHIYDSIENWIYGAFMCQLISSLPMCCKLISRLSLLAIVFKRILNLFTGQRPSTPSSLDNQNETSYDYDEDEEESQEVNFKPNRPRVRSTHARNRGKLRLVRSLFEWPVLVLVILAIWAACIVSVWPIFASYSLSQPAPESTTGEIICDSVYRFPEDIKTVSQIHFNYLVYGLLVPCGLIALSLVVLFVLQRTTECSNHNNGRRSSSSLGSQTSSSTSTPNKKFKSSSTASFDEINNSATTTTSTGSSSSSSSCFSRSTNNILLWLMLLVILGTSLPQELYRYVQLKIDFNNDEVLYSYLESILVKPIVRARPYYAMQLLYISEFALMPLLFLIFYLCSSTFNKRHTHRSISTTTSTTLSSAGGKKSSFLNLLNTVFYDSDLVKATSQPCSAPHQPPISNSSSKKLINDPTANNFSNNYPLLGNKPTSAEAVKKQHLRPTPFELAASSNEPQYNPNINNNNNNNNNVLHIIQHPSWRINIKQQSNKGQQQPHQHLANNEPANKSNVYVEENGNIQLPFSYVKTNMYNS